MHASERHHVCRGKPLFKNPIQQKNAIRKASRCDPLKTSPMLEPGCFDAGLARNCRMFSKKLIDRQLMRRIQMEEQHIDRNARRRDESNNQEENTQWIADKAKEQTEHALCLDLQRRPRHSRSGATAVRVNDRRQGNEQERSIAIHTASQWGHLDPHLANKQRKRTALAACMQVSYDFGFQKCFATMSLPRRWCGELNKAIMNGDSADPLSPSHSGSILHVDQIDKQHPGCLHELFRCAQKVLGVLATFNNLAKTMNDKSAVAGENRGAVALSRKQLAKWFNKHNGKERSAVEKPLLTPDLKRQRCEWALKHHEKILDRQNTPFAFLDKKWFYTADRRRKIKESPMADCEQTAPDTVDLPRIRSRRFPVKVTFLGAVACPVDEHDFDDRVCLKRVGEAEEQKRLSRNKSFSVDMHINEAMKKGQWKELHVPGQTTTGELSGLVGEQHDLDQFVADCLEFSCKSHTAGGNEKRNTSMETDVIDEVEFLDKDGERKQLTTWTVESNVVVQRGEMAEKDATCDSKFMLNIMPEVANNSRQACHWMPETQTACLGMDDAGGHGTNETKESCIKLMEEKNIEIVWQSPRLPETNMSDLGMWMSMQSAVTRTHRLRRCNHEALAKSVCNAWEEHLSVEAFFDAHGRLKAVMKCMVDAKGGNELVEKKRGKLNRDATVVDLTELEEEEGDGHEGNNDATNHVNLAEFEFSDNDSLGSV